MDDVFAPREFLECNRIFVHPLSPWSACRDGILDLIVFDNATANGVHEEHAPGLEPAFADHFPRINVVDTDLRGHDDKTVVGNEESTRSQPVPIQCGTSDRSIRKRECRGTVPGFHQ
ncbi:unannotated protein [freshwater metagenome]|uniref:Unannotated protein n=1 Tax=freshwater metagenome TaxID=449393 RepID=A0A6J7CIY8_9ZZZZ